MSLILQGMKYVLVWSSFPKAWEAPYLKTSENKAEVEMQR
jgi:hypothetical protein